MAAGNGVWGIDIGQCGLKALRGELAADGNGVVATSFDYIEYPKILSQPDAVPDQLVREALKEFLGRNNVRGDKVGISISGQSGLARFIKLPPVDAKKIPDIVKYEAKQQIPFALDDVIWDYQLMPSHEADDEILERMVGLFAMKRDQVFRTIQPLVDAEVELDIIQLTPIAIYNAIAYDQLIDNVPDDEDEDPDSVVILSLGTEASDLVVTNGFNVWQRSIPLGGNHFTKQLTKELKLTYAKAEQAKRTARDSKDAKKIIQAMRPVYNTLVTELQRSIGFFKSLERGTELHKIIVLGNATKLPGLSQYIAKNLEMEVVKLDAFKKLSGGDVVNASAFEENLLAFPVCYGLVLQGLKQANLSTNLVPREIVRQRMIRRKKPWAAAIAATILLGCAFNYFFHWSAWNSVNDSYAKDGVTWEAAKGKASSAKGQSGRFISTDSQQLAELQRLYRLGDAVVGGADNRLLWLEMLTTITHMFPQDPAVSTENVVSVEDRPLDGRKELYITSMKCKKELAIEDWVSSIEEKYNEEMEAVIAAKRGPVAEGEEGDSGGSGLTLEKPSISGPAWVVELSGFHLHSTDTSNRAANYIRNELISKLEWGDVELPTGPGQPPTRFTTKELGIYYPVLVVESSYRGFEVVVPSVATANASARSNGAPSIPGSPGTSAADQGGKAYTGNAHRFTVQFAWIQTPLRERLEKRQAREAEASVVSN